MSIYYVYILKCINRSSKKETLYTGSTNNLKKRIDQHQSGRGARYTRGKDLDLVYFETHLSRSSAMKREYEIKNLPVEKKWQLVKEFKQSLNQ